MIQINNLGFSYGNIPVLDNITMKLEPGRIYGLLGENGVGKTTLLTLLCGLKKTLSGSIDVDGSDPYDREPDLLASQYYLPDEVAALPVKAEQFARMEGEFWPDYDHARFLEIMRLFENDPEKKMNAMSAGQLKKTYISFALSLGCRYLYLDEPTNGLDIPSKSQFRKVIANNMTDDRILIISTHQVHDIESLLDHVLILSQSNLLLNASVSDISDDYKFEYRTPAEMDDSVLYAEPSLQGNAVIIRRQPADNETPMNLELLFNSVITGKLR